MTDGEPKKRIYLEPEIKIVEITPDLAAEWLDCNINNRSRREDGAGAYSRDMRAGDWKLTGDTIKFDWYGTLIDGQHRLEGVLRSGEAIQSVVIWGVDPEAQQVVDSGMARSFKDQLVMGGGHPHAATVAALARRVHQWYPPLNERLNFSRARITHSELKRTVEQRAHELAHCADFVEPLKKRIDLSASWLAFIYWVLRQHNAEAAADFMTKMATGAALEDGDPVLVLRDRIRREREKKRGDFNVRVLWLSVIAWNNWMDGNTDVSRLQFPKGGMTQDTFPKVRKVQKNRAGAQVVEFKASNDVA